MLKPYISIIMGSDSDLPVMSEAAKILEEFGIPYELTIVSAHRTPERMYAYAKDAHTRGIKIIIAGAGGAAHLPGMVASLSPLPVIGVPVKTSTLYGLDSLYSIVQMPPGIPVATVAINGAKNAGLLAAKILATTDAKLQEKVIAYAQNLESSILQKAEKLEQVGFATYLAPEKSEAPVSKQTDILETVDIPHLGKKQNGKVRDFYVLPDKRVIITTDRQSAFDVMLGHIPYKGAVLNQLAAFWFGKTKHIVPNHMISVPHPNVLVAHNCEPIPVEMIVRGYISGVTKTSIWYSYQKGERHIYGVDFPDGLVKNQKLPRPVITPTTHGGGAGGHDDRLTKAEIIEKKLASKKLYEQMEEAALKLFAYGSKLCLKQGLILVDTKYEFGLLNGKLMLMDEMHTPDSSRFWIAKTYQKRFKKGEEPDNFDKEFLRLWYAQRGYRGDGPPPPMPESLQSDLSKRYIAVYEKITGKKFKKYTYPVEKDIKKALSTL